MPLRLGLLLLVLAGFGGELTRLPLLVLAGAGLVVPRALHSPGLWAALAGLLMAQLYADWPEPDNHVYLTAWWCLAVAVALSAGAPTGLLASRARWLIGLCFAFAALWKGVLSDDYLSGAAFAHVLIADPRFTDLVLLTGALDEPTLLAQRAALRALPLASATPPVLGSAALALGAWMLTVWTLAIELALAGLFLLVASGRVRADSKAGRLRNPLLALFVLTTYSLATVEGFGWLLVTLGAAQCEPTEVRWRHAYVAMFFVILAYGQLPWASLLWRITG